LLEQTLAQMDNDNGNAALWFASQLVNLGWINPSIVSLIIFTKKLGRLKVNRG
jgi:hypothetical protein